MDIDPLPASPVPLLALIDATMPSFSSAQFVALVIACCALLLSGFISGCEISYFSLDRESLDRIYASPKGPIVKKLISKPERLLATILIGNNLVNVMIVILANFALGPVFKNMPEAWSFVLQTVLLTFLILLFGEIIPKLYAQNNPERWAKMAAGGIYVMMRLFGPLSSVLVRSQAVVDKVVTKKPEELSSDDLKNALKMTDVKNNDNKQMFEDIIGFGHTTAAEIMTLRLDITDIEISSNFSEVMAVVNKDGFSRIPVYEESQDNIKGILYSRDLLPYIHEPDSFDWRKLIRKPYFVPESRMIDKLLEDFRRRKIHMAIVVDEFGGTQGLVTLEDVLEEIVGDINDEYDEEEKQTYKRIAPDTFVFDGKTLLEDFFEVTGLKENYFGKSSEGVETLAGLILALKGDFPQKDESVVYRRCHFTVLKIVQHRIAEIRVKVMP